MLDVRVMHPVAGAGVDVVRALADLAANSDGHPSLGEAVWRDLADPAPTSRLLVASMDDEPIGVLHLAPTEGNDRATYTAAVVTHPKHRGTGVATALVEAAVRELSDLGAARLELWAFGADERADRFALGVGFRPERELWQMRVPLPVRETARWAPGVRVRTFEPGRDDAEWLEVNNRAFADDPDQGGWSPASLRRRVSEAWFDPSGFLLAFDDQGLAGFCWTKIHPAAPPREPVALGEIYVIGVDPDRRGTGLGRALTVAGLESLYERGTPVGMLFVDAGNTAASNLYRSLGFERARVDRAYVRDLP